MANINEHRGNATVVGVVSLYDVSLAYIRLMTMSPLYPGGKPCSTRTHNETVKNLALFSAFDRSNHDRTTAVALFNGHSSERKCDKDHVKQTLNQRNLV